MTKQPESLRLADALEQKEYPPRRTAAAELRRLHAENERLREAVKAEREACADIASTCCEGCADDIRARGNK